MNIPSFSIILLLIGLGLLELGKRKRNRVIAKAGGSMALFSILLYIIVYLGILK